MQVPGGLPDVLALDVTCAVRILHRAGFACEVIRTSAPGRTQEGRLRVVRQRMSGCGKLQELTVAAEDWEKGGVTRGF